MSQVSLTIRRLAERFVEGQRHRFLDELQQVRETLEPMLLVTAGGGVTEVAMA